MTLFRKRKYVKKFTYFPLTIDFYKDFNYTKSSVNDKVLLILGGLNDNY